jgi:hypothetical protein
LWRRQPGCFAGVPKTSDIGEKLDLLDVAFSQGDPWVVPRALPTPPATCNVEWVRGRQGVGGRAAWAEESTKIDPQAIGNVWEADTQARSLALVAKVHSCNNEL